MIKIFTSVKIVLTVFILNGVVLAQPIAEGKSKFIGSAYSNAQASNFALYWNQVTPENGGKWGSVESSRDQMNWGEASAAYNLAKTNGFKFRYHVLVWGNQQPGWIQALEPAEQLEEIEEWFAAVAQKFPEIDYLEVVNEPLHDPPTTGNGGYIGALGGSNGLYGTGWDWIIKSFELARQYFPASTKLMLNDFSIVSSTSSTAQYVEIIHLLQERDLIDGIGVQAHAFSTRSASASLINSNLNTLAATGLPIQVCEMDIDGLDDQVQLAEYKRIFPTFWQHSAVEGITLWGWRRGLWRDAEGAYLVDAQGAPRPALEWLATFVNALSIPEIISPKSQVGVARNALFFWHPTDSATSYHIEIATDGDFTEMVLDTSVTDTMLQLINLLQANKSFYWHVRAENNDRVSEYSSRATFRTGDQITSIKNYLIKPDGYRLYQNFPNPFNPSTTIGYNLPLASRVLLVVYNISGQRLRVLVDAEQEAGQYFVPFIAADLSSGIYFYKLIASGYAEAKPMLLLK